MRLSPNFSLAEAVKSQTALRLGIDNTPTAAVIDRMKAVCEAILEPVREHFQRPVVVNSFYRSPILNNKVGGAENSQHVKGEAVDFEIMGVPNAEVAEWVRDNLEYDMCALEFYTSGQPNSGWVHVSYKETGCRGECITIGANGTVAGLVS